MLCYVLIKSYYKMFPKRALILKLMAKCEMSSNVKQISLSSINRVFGVRYMSFVSLNRNINNMNINNMNINNMNINNININKNFCNSVYKKFSTKTNTKISKYQCLGNAELIRKCLEHYFGLKSNQIETIFQNYPNLRNQDINDFENVCSYLSQNHFNSNIITNSSWVLSTPKISLNEGFRLLESHQLIPHIINGKTFILVVLLLPPNRFNFYLKKIIKSNFLLFNDFYERINYFCNELNLTQEDFCAIVYNHCPLLTLDFDRIKQIMALVKGEGMKTEDIVTDIWIFRHNIDLMKKRIHECKLYDYPIKGWVLRSPDKVWYTVVNAWKENAMSKDLDYTRFIADKLNCETQVVLQMAQRHPRLLTIKVKKLEDIFAFLYSYGYSSQDIISRPQVLSHSLQRMKSRIKEGREVGIQDLPLYTIMKTDKQFKEFIKYWKRSQEEQE